MSLKFKEMLWVFRNQSYQEVALAYSAQFSMFPASLPMRVSESFPGVSRLRQETFKIFDSASIETQMPIRSPLMPDLRYTPSHDGCAILTFDRKETVLAFRFQRPVPALFKPTTNLAPEPLSSRISRDHAISQPSAMGIFIPAQAPVNLDRIGRTTDYPQLSAVLRTTGCIPAVSATLAFRTNITMEEPSEVKYFGLQIEFPAWVGFRCHEEGDWSMAGAPVESSPGAERFPRLEPVGLQGREFPQPEGIPDFFSRNWPLVKVDLLPNFETTGYIEFMERNELALQFAPTQGFAVPSRFSPVAILYESAAMKVVFTRSGLPMERLAIVCELFLRHRRF